MILVNACGMTLQIMHGNKYASTLSISFLNWSTKHGCRFYVDINDQLIIIDYRLNIEIYNTIILTDIYIHIVHIE